MKFNIGPVMVVMVADDSMEYRKSIEPGTSFLNGLRAYPIITVKKAFLFK